MIPVMPESPPLIPSTVNRVRGNLSHIPHTDPAPRPKVPTPPPKAGPVGGGGGGGQAKINNHQTPPTNHHTLSVTARGRSLGGGKTGCGRSLRSAATSELMRGASLRELHLEAAPARPWPQSDAVCQPLPLIVFVCAAWASPLFPQFSFG